MKKLFKVACFCVILVLFVVVLIKTSILENILAYVFCETESSQSSFDNNWYFNTLSKKEQDVYLKLARAIGSYDNSVVEVGDSTLSVNVATRAYEAYLMDNPDCFYLNNKYEINEVNILNITKIEIKLDYIADENVISKKIRELDKEIDAIIAKVITPSMSEFEKELALHDYLIENVRYYDYTNIEDIPAIKHTAYGALIEKEAVCDGISKAYSLLLDRCKIKNIVVTGKVEERHAWNKVKLENEWYNTDVTSDMCGKERVVSHVYFNVTDEKLSNTHVFDSMFNIPDCYAQKYDYYEYKDFKVTAQDFFENKMQKVIKNANEKVLEFKIDNSIGLQAIAQELYNQNFNNYKTNNVHEIKYFYIQDVIVIPKWNS